jgi:response regulator RpfG family c-di-GMP phosphodiesterase
MNDPTPAIPPPRVLFVDDEPSILSALRRLFRAEGYDIRVANSGREGLEMLEQQPVDLVVSDMRMPEMDGAQFLEQVCQRWPDAKRLLLTGYADVTSTVAAINRGQIWRYIAKPWNDDEIRLTVRQALEDRRLRLENARLVDALRELNAGLEQKVAARTGELQQTLAFLEQAHGELKQGFLTMVRVMTGLFELRSRALAGHARRVADIARKIAIGMGLPDAQVQEILLAALLHDIGKFGQPEHLLEKPFNAMSPGERTESMRHPVRGETLLASVEQLRGAALLVRHHHECFDGTGYPDHLAGLSIPQGARIIAVANDFDALQIGTLVPRKLKAAEARSFIFENRGKRYDPAVVDIFLSQVADDIPEEIAEIQMRPGTARPGMVLTRDLTHPDGYLLLAKGRAIESVEIDQLLRIESSEGIRLTLFVQPEKK